MSNLIFAALFAAGAIPVFAQDVHVRAESHEPGYKPGETVCIVATLKDRGGKLENGGLSFGNDFGGLPMQSISFTNGPDGSYKMCGRIAPSVLKGEYQLQGVNLLQTNGYNTSYNFGRDFKEVIKIRVESDVHRLSELESVKLVPEK